jgi:hypothetical protein
MAKQSPFRALVDRQMTESAAPETAHDAPQAPAGSHPSDQSLSRPPGKSSSPDYQRLTVYLRRDTILDIKRQIVGTNTELSDIVQQAVERWLRSR